MRVERVHRVVLGRAEHASVEREGLRVDGGVEIARPRAMRREAAWARWCRSPCAARSRCRRARPNRRTRGRNRPTMTRTSAAASRSIRRKVICGVLSSGRHPKPGPGYPARTGIERGPGNRGRDVHSRAVRHRPLHDHLGRLSRRRQPRDVPRVPRPAYLDDFDAWRNKYKNPFRDLQDDRRIRNWDDERRNSAARSTTASSPRSCSRTRCRRSSRASSSSRGHPKPDEYEHRLAGIRAHNRWLADWCARFPERRAGIGQIFLNDVDDAIDDVQWIKEHGLRGGVLISAIPPDVDYVKPLYDPVYDPLWKVCEDLEVPVNSHGGTGLPELRQVPGRRPALHHRGVVLLAAPVRAAAALGRVRALPEAEVRDDRDGLRVAPADARRASTRCSRRSTRPGAPASCATPRSTSCRSRRPSTSAQNCWVGVSQPGPDDARARARDRPRPVHVGERLPARRGHVPVHARAPAPALPRHRPARSCSSCSPATRRSSTTSTSTRSRRSPRRSARPSPSSREPLDELPDNPNEALLKAVGDTRL